ncbi:MAG: type VI secretion system tube protein Hcp [Xanthomonadales bacterium]|nr:type VI secretion system tube protein Hcp [Xanthomonadales bacterium]
MSTVLTRTLKFSFTISLLFLAFTASAASNMYLQITDAKGESQTIACASDTCKVDNLAAGEYQAVLCDAKGNPVRSSATMTDTVTMPRDAASGMASGKRMHKPMMIIKEYGKSSPQIYQLTIEESGSSAEIKVFGWDLATNKKS